MTARRLASRAFPHLIAAAALLAIGVAPAGAQAEKKEAREEKAAPAAPKPKVDLNSAPIRELEALPEITPAEARKIVDGRPYKSIDEVIARASLPARVVEKIRPHVEVRHAAADGLVDLNTADESAIVELPGVGPALAKAIVAARPYASVDDLRRVKGMGPAKVAAIQGRVKVGGEAPASAATASATAPAAKKGATAPKPALAPGTKININTATVEELDRLPGIGMARAQAIVAARPFEKPEDIMKVKGIKQVEFGKIKEFIVVK